LRSTTPDTLVQISGARWADSQRFQKFARAA
jgi:hypothetical protein